MTKSKKGSPGGKRTKTKPWRDSDYLDEGILCICCVCCIFRIQIRIRISPNTITHLNYCTYFGSTRDIGDTLSVNRMERKEYTLDVLQMKTVFIIIGTRGRLAYKFYRKIQEISLITPRRTVNRAGVSAPWNTRKAASVARSETRPCRVTFTLKNAFLKKLLEIFFVNFYVYY
jgi:hypothetical protein